MRESTSLKDQSASKNIKRLIDEILVKSSKLGSRCLYRGEAKLYSTVSSGLYRACLECKSEEFEISHIEKETVDEARLYTRSTDQDEIMAELQHFGGKTNWIDFTVDHLIALFFACEKDRGCDGRIVLHLPEETSEYRPRYTNNRIVAQKSVLIRPPRGFLVPDEDDEVVIVASEWKESILSYLSDFHGISDKSVFSDIHGYIYQQNPNRLPYATWFRESFELRRQEPSFLLCSNFARTKVRKFHIVRNFSWHQRNMLYRDIKDTEFVLQIDLEQADGTVRPLHARAQPLVMVELWTKRINEAANEIEKATAYCQRGEVRLLLGEIEAATDDFDAALNLNGKLPEAHIGRSHINWQTGRRAEALDVLNEAIQTRVVKQPPYMDLGIMRLMTGCVEDAIKDFSRVIFFSRNLSGVNSSREARFYRAVSKGVMKDWIGANEDFAEARKEGVLVARSFRDIFGEIDQFEKENDLSLPSTIRTQLFIDESLQGSSPVDPSL